MVTNSPQPARSDAWDLGAYEPCNHISRNLELARQFNYYLSAFQVLPISADALKSYFDKEPATKPLGLRWYETQLVWPAAYSQSGGLVQFNPALSKLDKNMQLARIYALTEIFDQVIYAQLHGQQLVPQLEIPLSGAQKDTLPQLLRIKLAKQQLAQHNQFFQESEPEVILDPYCAWSLACPRHAGSPEVALQEFNQAIASLNQLQTRPPV